MADTFRNYNPPAGTYRTVANGHRGTWEQKLTRKLQNRSRTQRLEIRNAKRGI